MEARTRAKSMKRSASMGRGASRSAARGKAKARAMGRAKRGGEIVPGNEPKPGDCVKHGFTGTAGKFLFIQPSDGFGQPQVVYEKNGERYHGNASEFSKCAFRGGEKRKKSLKKHHKRRAKRGGVEGDYDPELATKEQERQDLSDMEEGQSRIPQTVVPREVSPQKMEEGFAPKKGGKRRKSKKFYKGKASKTRKGRKDFVTHKGDKYFNRKGHRQTKRQGKSKSLFEQLFGL